MFSPQISNYKVGNKKKKKKIISCSNMLMFKASACTRQKLECERKSIQKKYDTFL